jgi:hypothetical protein
MGLWDEFISEDYVSHPSPYIGMGLSTRNTNEKMIVSSIASGGPEEGKLQVDDQIIRVEDDLNRWDTFEQLKTAVLGLGRTDTTINVRVRRGEQTFDYELTRELIEGFDIPCELPQDNYRTFLTDDYPDLKVTVKKMIAEGDIIACYNESQGANSDFNRQAIWPESVFNCLSEGKIVEEWYVSDFVGALKQLGYDINAPEA